ncbi:MAG: hypothetical protein IPO21_06990 [Bacteroidales bacterium]|nr:hypothetical protein [Bacteroidales bacterium]
MTKFGIIIGIIASIWVIYNIWSNHKEKSSEAKLLWTLAAIIPMLSIVTAIVYYMSENKKNKDL